MKLLIIQLQKALVELSNVVQQITVAEYCTPIKILSEATLGMHTRHIVEFFQCVLTQSAIGDCINYDTRSRNIEIQTNPQIAIKHINTILQHLNNISNKTLILETEAAMFIPTSLYRELYYNLEHTIHHAALLRVGLTIVASRIAIPTTFGVAPSTLQFQKINSKITNPNYE